MICADRVTTTDEGTPVQTIGMPSFFIGDIGVIGDIGIIGDIGDIGIIGVIGVIGVIGIIGVIGDIIFFVIERKALNLQARIIKLCETLLR